MIETKAEEDIEDVLGLAKIRDKKAWEDWEKEQWQKGYNHAKSGLPRAQGNVSYTRGYEEAFGRIPFF
jgi:hypothetical protein